MTAIANTPLSNLTTMGVGGSPESLVVATSHDELIATALELWSTGDDWLVLGGGSNVVAADDLSGLNVIQVATKGIDEVSNEGSRRVLRVQAGEDWDALVETTVANGLAGLEALSGIPGSVGAGPIQNIGAYGRELVDMLVRLEFLDYETGKLEILENADLGFAYRNSIFKSESAQKPGKLGIITWVEFELFDLGGLSEPINSGQLAGALGLAMGAQAQVGDIRQQVLKLRESKGMVYSHQDINSHGCGSFFTNPIVSDSFARTLPTEAPRWETPEDDGLTVKLSAAWLIEQAGIGKGFGLPGSGAAISEKHALAIVNRGGATAAEVVQLASFVQQRVSNTFGINLVPEPNLIGF
jgi:UDP-N-acetylmuramate dehydrogenase